jgi:RNA polymerase sigma-70 factor (ECF subfamily)
VPSEAELPARLRAVLAVLYLIFNQGYTDLIQVDLCTEAIRLGRVLIKLMPDEPEVAGLLALMLLTEARRPARIADGQMVLLVEQDRTRWDRELIAEGQELVRRCLRRNQPGPYQLQAAINAVHTSADDVAGTDWAQIKQLYDQLLVLNPTPVIALNRAVAVAEIEGPAEALRLVEEAPIENYYGFHSIRADLLRRLGRVPEARAAYTAALRLAENKTERDFLQRAIDDLPHT